MNSAVITASTSLRDVAFVVCTEMQKADVVAVLTGGSAATVYAPQHYQSGDLDFVLDWRGGDGGGAALARVGYHLVAGSMYRHATNPFTIDFPPGPLAVGDEDLTSWATLHDGEYLLHIIRPEDCVKDRLASYLYYRDRQSLRVAASVARESKADLQEIEEWLRREKADAHIQTFLDLASSEEP